ncbi:NADPH dehydrogenase [Acinetobacter bereziniae]|uniref:oxidoreductase n=1 Tax=Acinetobacter bereziniae TaxID=106648 RepID=UPI0021CD5609|nr:hypothetical protein [Acinetobacter bereziniae]MCU4539200.1 NADPH dehydrogenase [Acinetobacter bereziniae]
MSALLLQPITIRNTEFRNRIAMSPMCMHSATPDGHSTDFHIVHYGARALGGAGLIMLETSSVLPNGPIGPGDLGIWDDSHIETLSRVTSVIHRFGAKAGAQLGHAGRQLGIDLPSIAPSAIPFTDESRIPHEMTIEQIKEAVEAFRLSAIRAKRAGFDVIEIHCAHGYLLNEFLSPLANKRTDQYGGSHENRYRIVREVIDVVRNEWDGPLFLRISSTDYVKGGNRPEDFLIYGQWMKEQGIDLIDCSSVNLLKFFLFKELGIILSLPPEIINKGLCGLLKSILADLLIVPLPTNLDSGTIYKLKSSLDSLSDKQLVNEYFIS